MTTILNSNNLNRKNYFKTTATDVRNYTYSSAYCNKIISRCGLEFKISRPELNQNKHSTQWCDTSNFSLRIIFLCQNNSSIS